ncbi:MAG: hypothetical protein AMS27_05345 [Bacteroides sp. SM23_62_1]|nr:MAG: hypothetical protein AMS27_05345 [Bacteroides sp. SM23_62_1]
MSIAFCLNKIKQEIYSFFAVIIFLNEGRMFIIIIFAQTEQRINNSFINEENKVRLIPGHWEGL